MNQTDAIIALRGMVGKLIGELEKLNHGDRWIIADARDLLTRTSNHVRYNANALFPDAAPCVLDPRD